MGHLKKASMLKSLICDFVLTQKLTTSRVSYFTHQFFSHFPSKITSRIHLHDRKSNGISTGAYIFFLDIHFKFMFFIIRQIYVNIFMLHICIITTIRKNKTGIEISVGTERQQTYGQIRHTFIFEDYLKACSR